MKERANYYLWRLRAWLSIQVKDYGSDPPILVYQMGKVGSTTLAKAIRESDLANPVFHVHFLTQDGIDDLAKRYRENGVLNTPIAGHLHLSSAIRSRLMRDRKMDWLVVSGMRDPVARAISHFFQVSKWEWPETERDDWTPSAEDLARLRDDVENLKGYLGLGLDWFEQELAAVFDINIFDHSFDQSRGWSILEGGNVKALIYTLENMENVLEEGMASLMGRPLRLSRPRSNKGSEKPYAAEYKKLVKDFKLSRSACDRIYDSPVVRYFYDDRRIESFKQRWME